MSLLNDLNEVYWSLGQYGIDDERRMRAVIHELSERIREWAPDRNKAEICYLTINGVATRLMIEIDR